MLLNFNLFLTDPDEKLWGSRAAWALSSKGRFPSSPLPAVGRGRAAIFSSFHGVCLPWPTLHIMARTYLPVPVPPSSVSVSELWIVQRNLQP